MNKERRKAIESAVTLIAYVNVILDDAKGKLEEAQGILETAHDEEEEYLENMSENLKGGEGGQKAEAAIEALNSAKEKCEALVEAIGEFDGIEDDLETAKE